jgi:hypothetical protein
MNIRHLALAALLSPVLSAQAQSGMEAFNPMAMMMPVMTPMGAMLVPMASGMNMMNPAVMMNPAGMMVPMAGGMNMMNPAMMMNPMAMMPAMPAMPSASGFGMPSGMPLLAMLGGVPFAMPQMANPFPAGFTMMPVPMPAAPAQAAPVPPAAR